MKNTLKKLVTLGLATTLALGCTVTAFADETTREIDETTTGDANLSGTATGAGNAAFLDKKVYKVVVPTDAAMSALIAYTVDPQGLIPETNAEAFGSSVEIGEASGVYFKHMDGTTVKSISGESDAIEITNKSTSGVKLAIEAKMTAATGSDGQKFVGTDNYSTTADFSGSGDAAKALFIGVKPTFEVLTDLNETAKNINSVVLSAADQYEVKYATNAYTLAEKSDATFPKYDFVLSGALNPNAADTVWSYKDSTTNKYVAKSMPTISVKFTPSLIGPTEGTAKSCAIVWGETDFWISKEEGAEDGGFKGKTISAVTVNGKTLDASKATVDSDSGYIKISFAEVLKLFNSTYTVENAPEEVWGYIKSISFSDGTNVYYGEV